MHGFASIKLTKELWNLSFWEPSLLGFYDGYFDEEGHFKREADYKPSYPCYSLGYLLRKLPQTSAVMHFKRNRWEAYWVSYGSGSRAKREYGDTPEDAAAKLAIRLFKQGILQKGVK